MGGGRPIHLTQESMASSCDKVSEPWGFKKGRERIMYIAKKLPVPKNTMLGVMLEYLLFK
jgi:hypothetical protein